MIAIIDYGGGNLRSVQNGFAAAGLPTVVSDEPHELEAADGLVLPGVGAFGQAMKNLRESGLGQLLLRRVAAGVPLLGICLGLQLLFDRSEEKGEHAGLGLIAGAVVPFPGVLKVPQIGWNQLSILREHPLLEGISQGDYFYFVHSFYACPTDPEVVLASADYGGAFPAVVQKDNLFGIQFHPEKSSRLGLQILKNFGRLVEC
ncbi:MAG: imidazole glycerol phosphate synthase subunit HisH [Dethiobacter sp.]|jgi:glutamine amidotransferase|nr:imidazole glycerol phosphate synthase subunit HisH [Dethiobacter sp.]MBS3897219.1 imidazole glycerol phosphate synthase subunit HisH [Dethiobacter sp.]MBS3982457.1 imidazole glycerol phosphate synthase subunit HisH [Dethiobacter sp.]MCL4462539.1 imidazole glycerol phosphate synthase subunit HisH [Bacillota bacterium]MCL5993167.1 imidazole glycerol phosphate synthase subunit HisH [Bacillota bacterium]